MKTKHLLFLSLFWFSAAPFGPAQTSAFPIGAAWLNQDFLPSAVSRGGALSTAWETTTAAHYNPAILPRIKNMGVEMGLSAAIYPDMVYSEYVNLFFKTKQFPFYISIQQQHSSVPAVAKNNDEQGELLASAMVFSVSTGGSFKTNQFMGLSWGATLKVLTSKQYIFGRNYLMADFGVLADFPAVNMRASATWRNFGFDLKAVEQLFGTPLAPSNINAAARISVLNAPQVFGLGYQFRFLKKFCAMADLEIGLFEALNDDGISAFRPKVALCFEPIPSLSFNLGRTFKDAPGVGYFTFGLDYTLTVDKAAVVLQYALEPIPYLGFNNFIRLSVQFP